VLSRDLVPDRLVGAALPCKQRVHRFDAFARTCETSRLQELAQDLPAEQSVVVQFLVTSLEHRDRGVIGVGWVGAQIEAVEKVVP
jgi:hypothetical protein